MKTVFITGGEGFVGTHLVRHLRQQQIQVVAGVRNRARKLAYEREQVPALVCEVTDPINVARAIASVHPDGIVHLAGPGRSDPVGGEPLEAYRSIVSSWANVLDAVRRSVPRARVLLISACDVYGRAGSNGHPLLNESSPVEPVSTYGSLKKSAEDIAQTFRRDYHLDLTIARPFDYCGPGAPQDGYLGAVATRLAQWDTAAHGHELTLPDLSCERDWLHVADVVTAYARLLTEGQPGEAYNVCSGQCKPLREVVQMLVSGFGLDLQLTESTPADGQSIPRLRGDNAKLRQETGWTPTHTLEGAVECLVAAARSPETARV